MPQDRGITTNILHPHLCTIKDISVSDVNILRGLLANAMAYGSDAEDHDPIRVQKLWSWFNHFLSDLPEYKNR